MAIFEQTQFLERQQFFNGQRLFASDLQQLEAFNREMRWLHNQSLHQPGIGSGFEVIGKKGEREVSIMPGYTIDSCGREIVLPAARIEPVPPVAGDGAGNAVFYDLTVAYPGDRDLEEAETRAGVCLPRGVVRLREEPIFCWIRLGADGQATDPRLKQDVQSGRKIVLARAEIFNCQLNKDISMTVRRNARPASQPYVACGKVKPDWEFFEIGTPISDPAPTPACALIAPVGLKASIDTAGSRFQITPHYSARIEGSHIWRINNVVLIVDGLVNIVQPRQDGFEVQVVLVLQVFVSDAPATGALAAAAAPALETIQSMFESFSSTLRAGKKATFASVKAAQEKDDPSPFLNWHVVWMGIEG